MNTNYVKQATERAKNVKKPEDEKQYLRDLAALTVEIANEPRMEKIIQRWRDVNGLRRPDRAPVWCRPVGCWEELLPQSSQVCKDKFNRSMEREFLKILTKRDIGDDTPVFDYLKVKTIFDVTPENIWGLDIVRESLNETGSAWQYKPTLETPEDFKKLQIPEYNFNAEKTEEKLNQVKELLGGVIKIIPAHSVGGFTSLATLGHLAADLRGLEQIMMDMITEPELTHRMMNVFCQGALNYLDAVEQAGNIVPNNDDVMLVSDPLRPDIAPGEHTLKDCWIAANSQELDQVSPDMFNEFLLEYQKKIFSRFGAICYGCCENLTKKAGMVKTIPNLRIFVCSGWSDFDTIVEKVDKKYCFMWRHKASDVVCPDDMSEFKKYVETCSKKLQGSYYQVILRELQTLMGHPNRLTEWTNISIDAAEKFA